MKSGVVSSDNPASKYPTVLLQMIVKIVSDLLHQVYSVLAPYIMRMPGINEIIKLYLLIHCFL